MGEKLRAFVGGFKERWVERRAARRAAREAQFEIPIERETVLASTEPTVEAKKQERRVYPGGSQLPKEQFTPLTDRTPWEVPKEKFWVPSWYQKWREEIAVWLEVLRRLPFLGPVPIYRIMAVVSIFAIAPFVPGLSWFNAPLFAPIFLMGGSVLWVDALATFVMQPLVLTTGAIFWAADRMQGSVTGSYVKRKEGDWFAF